MPDCPVTVPSPQARADSDRHAAAQERSPGLAGPGLLVAVPAPDPDGTPSPSEANCHDVI